MKKKKCYSDYISKHTVKPYHSIPVKSLKLSAINFMANRWGNSGNSGWLYFWGSKITADGDCSHEIKRRLLLGRKAMTNLDSIIKCRNITSPTKVHLVKAIVFPVVRYGCESWTIKKLSTKELMILNCVVGEDSWESLGMQGDPTSQSLRKSVPEYSLEGLILKLKLQNFGHLMLRMTHWKRSWCWERLSTGGEGDDRG